MTQQSSFHYEFYEDNQSLLINNVNKNNDEGLYECIAENDVNKISSKANLFIKLAGI